MVGPDHQIGRTIGLAAAGDPTATPGVGLKVTGNVFRAARDHTPSRCDADGMIRIGKGTAMGARLTRRHAALSGFFAIPVGVASLFLAAPLLAGAASPGLAAGPGMGSLKT